MILATVIKSKYVSSFYTIKLLYSHFIFSKQLIKFVCMISFNMTFLSGLTYTKADFLRCCVYDTYTIP